MASQISHIVYAKKYLEDDHPNWIDKDQFILGCVFPDIRLIDKNISRKDTHMYFEKIDLDFSGLTSFEAGWKFHLYCDMRRNEILNKYDFFEVVEYNLEGIPSKLLEDKLIYDEYNNWEKLCFLMNHVPYFETETNVSRETFEHWYAIIARYIKEMPNKKTMHCFRSKIVYQNPTADEVIKGVERIENSEKALNILKNIKEEII